MKKLVIGIASQQAIRARALAIAHGDHQLRPNEPKIWFASMRSLAEVLSDDNRVAACHQGAEARVTEPARGIHRTRTQQSFAYAQDDGTLWTG